MAPCLTLCRHAGCVSFLIRKSKDTEVGAALPRNLSSEGGCAPLSTPALFLPLKMTESRWEELGREIQKQGGRPHVSVKFCKPEAHVAKAFASVARSKNKV